MTQTLSEIETEFNTLRTSLQEKRKKTADCLQEVTPIARPGIRIRKTLQGHLAKVVGVDWDGTSQYLVSASQDGKLIIWDPITGLKRTAILLKSSWVMCCSYSPGGNFVACGGLDNILSVYDLMGNESKPRTKREFIGHEEDLFLPLYLSTKIKSLAQVETQHANQKTMSLLGHHGDVMKVALKPEDQNILATCSCDKTCRIWDLRLHSPCVQLFASHEDDINCLAFHPNGYVIATASDDGTCRLYDLTADNEISCMVFENAGNKIGCSSVSFSRSGRLLFIGQDDHTVSINDALMGTSVGHLTDHDNRISCLKVSPDGSALATSCWDGLLRIFA